MKRGLPWLALGLLVLTLAPAVRAQTLGVTWVDGKIRVGAPALHFVEGPIAERLRSGVPTPFLVSLSVAADDQKNVVKRTAERVVISYDLWEERFATALPHRKLGPVSHRTPAAAEAWCLDQLAMTATDLPARRRLWFTVEVQVADRREETDPSIPTSLGSMIDLFGQKPSNAKRRWTAEMGPVELDAIPREPGGRPAGEAAGESASLWTP